MIILKIGGIELNYDYFPCDNCPLLLWEDGCGFCCGFNKDGGYGPSLPEHYEEKDIYPRPDWCPLRELPDHMADYNPEIHPANEPFDAGYTLGWNECLNQIEGDNKGDNTDE